MDRCDSTALLGIAPDDKREGIKAGSIEHHHDVPLERMRVAGGFADWPRHGLCRLAPAMTKDACASQQALAS